MKNEGDERQDPELFSKDFVPREEWPEYDITHSVAPFLHPRKEDSWIYYGMWPLYLAVYFGQTAPNVSRKKFWWPTIFVWDTVNLPALKERQGWIQIGNTPRKRLGVLEVRDEFFYKKWSTTAKYDRKVWLTMKDVLYEIVDMEAQEFFNEYRKSDTYIHMGKDVRNLALHGAERRLLFKKVRVHFLAAKESSTGKVLAGFVYEASTTGVNTYYSIGFVHSYKEKAPLMTGLINEWIERERVRGYIWFNFGAFWKPGDPKSWIGYTNFKKKFGVVIHDLPPSRIKIKWFW